MSLKAHIRFARLEDSEALAQIQVDSYRAAYAGILPQSYLEQFSYEEQTQDWHDLLIGEMTDILLVAAAGNGEVIGYALGRPGATGITSYDSELVSLHVRQSVQGQGVGRQLMTEMAWQLQQQGCTALMLWVLQANQKARSLYEHLGGQLIGQQQIDLGEGDVTATEVAYGWLDINTLVTMAEPAPIQAYQAEREVLLARITATLSADERFAAAWLTGSYARNEADAFSDLDLTVVVREPYTETLCARPWQKAAQTTAERLALFRQFGEPAVIHENNDNAPEGGTFTFVLYQTMALVVDWTLMPEQKATRPRSSLLLFDKADIPLAPPPAPVSLEERAASASEIVGFFWMMVAVTAKYLARRDAVFLITWLEVLQELVDEVERLVQGSPLSYWRGSRTQLAASPETQQQLLLNLCHQMETLMPHVAAIGSYVSPSPLATIKTLLQLRGKHEIH